MNRSVSIYGVIFAVVMCAGAAFAQQDSPAKPNDNDDSCSHFKMRVRQPSATADYKLRVRKPAEELDPQMVLNPCPQIAPPVAYLALPAPGLNEKGKYLAKPLPLLRFRRNPKDGTWSPEVLGNQLPPAMELMKPR